MSFERPGHSVANWLTRSGTPAKWAYRRAASRVHRADQFPPARKSGTGASATIAVDGEHDLAAYP